MKHISKRRSTRRSRRRTRRSRRTRSSRRRTRSSRRTRRSRRRTRRSRRTRSSGRIKRSSRRRTRKKYHMRGGMNVLDGVAIGASGLAGLAAVGTGLHYKYGLTNERRTNLNYPEIQTEKDGQPKEEKLVTESKGWEPSKEIFKIFSKDGLVLTREEYKLYLKTIGSFDPVIFLEQWGEITGASKLSIGYDDFRRVRYKEPIERMRNENELSQNSPLPAALPKYASIMMEAKIKELANEEFNKIDEYMLYASYDHDPGGKLERVYSLPEGHPSKQYLGLKESNPLYHMKLYRQWTLSWHRTIPSTP
jgi:hypothetical protein